jgi:hypothetical protein
MRELVTGQEAESADSCDGEITDLEPSCKRFQEYHGACRRRWTSIR